jgi:kinesin family protein 1
MIRRPLLFVYNNDRDPLERGVINLSTAQILYNEEQLETQYVFIFINQY